MKLHPPPLRSCLALLWLGAGLHAQSASLATTPVASTAPTAAVVRRHAAHCHRLHLAVAARAATMRDAIDAMLAAPSQDTLDRARSRWCEARADYGQLEALRFHGGPIDAVEPLLNAWPLDEVYIDRIIADADTWRTLGGEVLEHANELGSETDISVGWHAIEYLLWGRDHDPAGPGCRPHTDYLPDHDRDAARRRHYLRTVTARLLNHLDALSAEWAPDTDNFRRRFEQQPESALRRMLTGAVILTGFELAGERLAVAYETRDQEQEHSCFSDTTCDDLVANQLGICALFDGGREPGHASATLLSLIAARDAELADHLRQCLQATLVALRAIPAPFDQAFLGADDAPGRLAILRAIEALEQQAEAIAIAGQLLGHELPLQPGN